MTTVQVRMPLVELIERAIAAPGGDQDAKEALLGALHSQPTIAQFASHLRSIAEEVLEQSKGSTKSSGNGSGN